MLKRALVVTSILGSLALSGACVDDLQVVQKTPAKREAPAPVFWGPDCDPIVPWHCGFPFPSSTALVDDPSTPTKKRVAFRAGALPRWKKGTTETNPAPWNDSDGFSASGTLLTYMWRATAKGLPTEDDIASSTTPRSRTIVMEADTGALVPHFSDLDMSVKSDDDRAIIIRPVARLRDRTRYIVAIQGVVDADGAVLPPSPAFLALRDGTAFEHPTIAPRRALYADILGRLDKAGVARKNLQLAWDFQTASRENNTRWLLSMRDESLAQVGEDGPEYRIVEVKDDVDGVARRVEGMMKVPLYLDQATINGRLVRDGATRLPKQNGTAEYPFTVWVPKEATSKPGALLQNGHGLLGGRHEGAGGYLTKFASKYGYVAFAVDWTGMAGEDAPGIAEITSGDIGRFAGAVERQHQGHLGAILAMRLMRGRFPRDPAVQFDGKSAIDPTLRFYRGDSQGGIFGGVYMSLSTDVTRGLLSVPGAPYSMLLDRSADFFAFRFLIGLNYSNAKDVQLVMELVQMLWDRTEPGGWMGAEPLPGTPRKDILFHVALGDRQVTPLGAHWMARTVGAKLMTPAARPIWGIPEQPYPFEGSGLVEFDTQAAAAPKTNVAPPPADVDPHNVVRHLDAAQKMADTFFRTGKITATCDGKCDPE